MPPQPSTPARGRSPSPRPTGTAAKSRSATPQKKAATNARSATPPPAKKVGAATPPVKKATPSKKASPGAAAASKHKTSPAGATAESKRPPRAEAASSSSSFKKGPQAPSASSSSFKKGPQAVPLSSARHEEAEEAEASAKLAALPPALAKWIRPAPSKHGKAYAARINDLFGSRRSCGELLFLTEPCELAITIDAAHDHTTLSALQILRLVDVVGLKRNGARRPPDLEPSLKMQMGDELTLRALPHVLSTVAVSKGGKVVLAPKHARDKLARQVRAERAALLAAAEALQAKLLPLVRLRLGELRERTRMRVAATRLQCAWRGRHDRSALRPLIEGKRARKRAAQLRSRKLLACLLHQQHLLPVYTETRLSGDEEAARVAEAQAARGEWRARHGVVAAWYASATALAKGHATALNRTIAAAPESTKRKLSARRLARSPLSLLRGDPMELTVAVDQSGNNLTVKGLMLPKTLTYTKVTVNGKVVVAKRPAPSTPPRSYRATPSRSGGCPTTLPPSPRCEATG